MEFVSIYYKFFWSVWESSNGSFSFIVYVGCGMVFVERVGVFLVINYFYSCCFKNRRDKNCIVCFIENVKRISKEKFIDFVL